LKHRSIEQTFADRRLIRNDDHGQSQGRKLS